MQLCHGNINHMAKGANINIINRLEIKDVRVQVNYLNEMKMSTVNCTHISVDFSVNYVK